MPSSTQSITKVFLALLSATSVAHAHSWIEQLTVIAPNGTFVGEPGYPRGNILRSEPGFGDTPMVYLVPDGPTAPMCKDTQKSPASQSETSPRLNAAAGADIALRYQENGHVTLPDAQIGKAENRGDVYVYGTTQPKDNELFNEVHGVWTADGTGGDGRGVLLVKASYDDGQCYQINDKPISQERRVTFAHPSNPLMGADLWCQTDLRLPADAPTDKPYTLYWVWDWATAAGLDPNLPDGKNETYTSCMDVSISAAADVANKVASTGFVEGQPIENAAVPAQFNKLGEQADPASPAPAPSASAPASPAPVSSGPAASASTPASTPAATVPASSVPATSASAPAPPASTIIAPIPGPDALTTPSAVAPSDDAATMTMTTMMTVTTTEDHTTTVYFPASALPEQSAVPRMRGRNPVFHRGN